MFQNLFTQKNIIILIILIIIVASVIYLLLKDSKHENFVSYDEKNKDYKRCSNIGGPCFPEYNGNTLSILDIDYPVHNGELLNYCESFYQGGAFLWELDKKNKNCQTKPLINKKNFQTYIVEQLNKNKSKANFKNKLIWIQFRYRVKDESREAWILYLIDSKGIIYDLTNDGTYFSTRFPYMKIYDHDTHIIGNVANDGYFKPYIQLYESDKDNKLSFEYYNKNTRIQIKDTRDTKNNRFKDLRFDIRKIGELKN